MKNSRPSLRVKFLIGLALYAAVIVGLTFVKDYRVSIAGLFILGAITFALSLWTALSKKVITFVVAASLAFSPARANDPGDPPPPLAGVIFGCGCLVVGGIIIWGVLKCCKRLPAPPKKGHLPPDTNELASVCGPINSPAPPLTMPDTDLSNSGSEYEVMALQFQSSINGAGWQTEYTATNWLGPDRIFSVLYSNNVPLMTNQCRAYWTNESMIMNFSEVMRPKTGDSLTLWRAVQIQ